MNELEKIYECIDLTVKVCENQNIKVDNNMKERLLNFGLRLKNNQVSKEELDRILGKYK